MRGCYDTRIEIYEDFVIRSMLSAASGTVPGRNNLWEPMVIKGWKVQFLAV